MYNTVYCDTEAARELSNVWLAAVDARVCVS